eukprot:CAMPEP_0197023312 /NCGR_PEP_ID=MMETSP1384-20130603/4035_1 /TAXON_ID=29189 /ORGANISM="Ammonia sp." /LENGTH=1311 /DNA_ID=CAMNT_0042451507 /DNA_START=226 /DNA_END=4161 /DNA_ORIENTATION=-
MTLCPDGADTACMINCTDSFSCFNLTVTSSSGYTQLNCSTPDMNTSNICTRARMNVVSGNVSINCMQTATNQDGDDMLVCDQVQLDTTMNSNVSSNITANISSVDSVSFRCVGNGANCKSIDIDATNALSFMAEISGLGSNLNDSFFISNAPQFDVVIAGLAVASDNTFRGNDVPMSMAMSMNMSNVTSSNNVTVHLREGGTSLRNSYIFGGLFSTFQFIGDAAVTPSFSSNVVNITNPMNITQTLNVSNMAGDSSNMVSASNLTNFTFTCDNEQRCGFGTFTLSMNNAFTVSAPGNGLLTMATMQNNQIRATLNFVDQNAMLSLRCLALSCENVTANLSCSAALPCNNVSISAEESYLTPVRVHCGEKAQCNAIRIENKMGATMVNISNGTMNNSNIAGDPLYIVGNGSSGVLEQTKVAGLITSDVTTVTGSNGFVFRYNTFELNNNASIMTDNTTTFLRNVLRSTDTSSITVSVNDSAMNFNKSSNKEYNFNAASNLMFSMTEGQLFKSGIINVFQNRSTVAFSNQGGRFFGTTFNCDQCLTFNLITNGTNSNLSVADGRVVLDAANTFNLRNVSNASFAADNGAMLTAQTIVVNVGNQSNVTLTAYSGGIVEDVEVQGIGVTITNLNLPAETVLLNLGRMYIGVEANVAVLELNRSLENFTIDAEPADDLSIMLNSNVFADNIIRANEITVTGDGPSRFVNNALVASKSTTNCTLSINSDDYHNASRAFVFKQTNDSLVFMQGDFVNLTLLNATFHNVTIDVHTIDRVLIYSDSAYVFADNVVRVNQTGKFEMLGADGTNVVNTTIVDRDSNAQLSFGYLMNATSVAAGNQSNMTSMVNMTKMGHQYMFARVSYVNVTVPSQGQFMNNMLMVADKNVNVTVLNNGTYSNNTISAEQLTSLNVHCWGRCYSTGTGKNSFLVSNISQNLVIDVQSGDVLNELNTLFNFDNVANVLLSAQNNGLMEVIRFVGVNVSNSIMVLNDNGTMNDMEVNAGPNTQMFMLSCKNGGCQSTERTNTFGVMGAAQLCIMAEQDVVNMNNTHFHHLNTVPSIMLHSSGANAVLRDIAIDSAQNSTLAPNVSITVMKSSNMRNVSLTAKHMQQIRVNVNSQAVLQGLMVEPETSVTDIVVNTKQGRFANSVIDATTASNLTMMCSANSTAMNCNNLTIHVPTSSKPSLVCSEVGCSNMVFYTTNGFEDLDMKVADCPCDIAVKTSCINGELEIYCSAQDSTPSVFVNNTCTGKCCGDIVDDLKVEECYNGGGGSGKKKTGAIVGGICGGIFAVILIVGLVYYFRRQKRLKDDPLIVNDESQ